jgi:GntR family transcriptional regulator
MINQEQIAEALRGKILGGELKPGKELPTVNELAREYNVTPYAVGVALKMLREDGLVESGSGRRTRVRVQPSQELLEQPTTRTVITFYPSADKGVDEKVEQVSEAGRQEQTPTVQRVVGVKIEPAGRDVAAKLWIAADDDVIIRTEKREIDGQAWSLRESYYPYTLSDRAPKLRRSADIPEGTVAYLASVEPPIVQDRYDDYVRVRDATQDESKFLQTGAQMLIAERIAYAIDGRPFRITQTICDSDRNEFRFVIGDASPAERQGKE